MSDQSIIVQKLNDPDQAGALFQEVLRRGESKASIVRVMKEHPEMALARLQQGDVPLGLTPKGSADILDELVGEVGDDRASVLIRDHLTPDRLQELLAARGDLPASAIYVASREDVLAAIAGDVGSSHSQSSEAFAAVVLRAWAYKIKDRSDYADILNMEVNGRRFRDYLLALFWSDVRMHEGRDRQQYGADAEEREDDEVLSADGADASPSDDELLEGVDVKDFEDLGLEPNEGLQALRDLLESGQLAKFDAVDISEARAELTARRKEIEQTPATLTEEARDRADEEADDLDF
jgi:hypothetical protein